MLPADADADSFPRFTALVNTKPMKIFLDWGSLTTFYALQGSESFTVASSAACAVGAISLALTHCRSTIDPAVISPKVLDVGFVITFGGLAAVAACGGKSTGAFLEVWVNAIVNACFCAITLVGVALGEPFVMAFAVEAGMPRSLTNEPMMIALFSDLTLDWALGFAAMAVVSCVAPIYQVCSSGGADQGVHESQTYTHTYTLLTGIFTYAVQYGILFGMIVNATVLGPRREHEEAKWLTRSPAEHAAAHGNPITAGHALLFDSASGFALPTKPQQQPAKPAAVVAVRTLRDERSLSDEEARCVEQSAAAVLSAAFVADPMFKTWRGFGEIADPAERAVAMRPVFGAFTRLCRRFNHCFDVGGGKAYCFCIPSWPGGDEHKKAWGRAAQQLHASDGSMLSPTGSMISADMYKLGKLTKRALRGRPHLYIAVLGADPAYQGKGFGRVALRAALMVADSKRVACALETMTRKNRAMYERYGFVAVASLRVDGCDDPWVTMVREPVAAEGGAGAELPVVVDIDSW